MRWVGLLFLGFLLASTGGQNNAFAQSNSNYCAEADSVMDSARSYHKSTSPERWNIDIFIQAMKDYRECANAAATVNERRYALQGSFDAEFYIVQSELHRSYYAKLVGRGNLAKSKQWFTEYHQMALSILHSLKAHLADLKRISEGSSMKWFANRTASLQRLAAEVEGISFDGLPDTFAQLTQERFTDYLAANIGGTPTATPSPVPTDDPTTVASASYEQIDAMSLISTTPAVAQLISSVSVSAQANGGTTFAWTMTSGALYASGTEDEKERFLTALSQLTRRLYLKHHATVNGISMKLLDENGNELASDEIDE